MRGKEEIPTPNNSREFSEVHLSAPLKVGGTELEQTSVSIEPVTSYESSPPQRGAESGALEPETSPIGDIDIIRQAWPNLTPAVRKAIMELATKSQRRRVD
mgnify:CR=1 FL=1